MFANVLAGLWTKLQSWLAAAGVALAVIAGAFLYGRSAGRHGAEAEQARNNAKATKKARGVEDEVNKMGGAELDRALGKWMRDGGR